MSVLAEWEKQKKQFEKVTGKKKPKTKIFGIAFKATGISKALALFDKAPSYRTKNAAMHLFVAQATAYMKALKEEADACDGKEDADYRKAIKDLADGIESVSKLAAEEITGTFKTMEKLVKSGKLKDVRKYCEGEFSTENFDFLMAVQKVKKLTDLRALLDEYISGSAAKEINLGSTAKKAYFSALRGEHDFKDAVDKLKNDAMMNLCDTLSRYINTLKIPKVKSTL